MKTIANLRSTIEAQELQLTMAAQGIQATIPEDVKSRSGRLGCKRSTSIPLQVAEEDEDIAIRVLNEVFSISE